MTLVIFGLPITLLIEMLTMPKFDTLYGGYLFYEGQCISLATINIVIMTVATARILNQMTQIFGQGDLHETVLIKRTLAILLFSLLVKMTVVIVVVLTSFSAITFKLFVTFAWLLTDVIPSTYLFKIHYSNFMSLEGLEYL